MADMVWLASYPKSGNTWLRVLLTNYLRDAEQPADINELDGGPIASSRVWFDEWAGIEASALDDETVDALRPGVYRCIARAARHRQYMKVHDMWSMTANGPMFPADITAAVIYVLRNPLDLVASLAHHSGHALATAAARLCDPQGAIARSHNALADQLRQRLGGWSNHLASWVDQSGLPVMVVRYEDLKTDAAGQLRALLLFCGIQPEPGRVAKAVAFSSFGELRQQEREKGFKERPPTASAQFFRRGVSGGWRDELPADLIDQVVAAHGPMMRRFGYLDAQGEPL